MAKSRASQKPVLVVGGANGERVLSMRPEEFKPGRKHVLEPSDAIGGGSSINHACRLLGAGLDVLPVVPVLNDHTGQLVVRTLRLAATAGGTKDFQFKKSWFLRPKFESETTQFTTIVNVGDQRSVFSELSPRLADSFLGHFSRLIDRVNPTDVSAVMIGHIYADQELKCDLTRRLIDRFSGSVPIVANFGASQYEAGHLAWSNALRKVSYFQLDIVEMRRFFNKRGIVLREMLKWFRDKCTVVVTLDRMGAIAQTCGSDRIIQIWPYELPAEMVVDTTGAGDAFAAGVTYSLVNMARSSRATDAWLEIFARSTLWAAFACCQRGGTRDIPNLSDLDRFRREHAALARGVDLLDPMVGEGILRLVDLAFPR